MEALNIHRTRKALQRSKARLSVLEQVEGIPEIRVRQERRVASWLERRLVNMELEERANVRRKQ